MVRGAEGIGLKVSAKIVSEGSKALEDALATTLQFVGGHLSRQRHGRRWCLTKANATDEEIFLEAIELEKIGEFESPHVATAFADLALQVSDESTKIFKGEACPQPFVPLSLAIKAQAQGLTGELTIELVSGENAFRVDGTHEASGAATDG